MPVWPGQLIQTTRAIVFGGAVAIAAAAATPSAAQDDSGQSILELWRAGGPDADLEVEADGDSAVVRPLAGGWVARLILPEDLPPAGNRSVTAEITVLEDGGGWPDRAVGAGLLYGYTGPNDPFYVALLSPQDGGVLQLLENIPDGGVSIGQSIGGDYTEVGAAVTVGIAESNGGIVVTAGQSSLSLDSDTIAAMQANDDQRMGVIVFGRGAYRFDNLQIGGN